MAAISRRATSLGAAGTTLMGAATWWLLRAAASTWPGFGSVQVEAGLGFLTVGGAGLVAGWATVLLAGATASLASSAGWLRSSRGRTDAEPGTAGRGLTGRVAAGLLVAASLGAAPATGAQPPQPAVVMALAPGTIPLQLRTCPGPTVEASVTTRGSAVGATEGPGEDARGAADEVPVPGWTPTVTSTEPATVPTGEVSLVSTAAVTAEHEVVVHRGDTLWDIAARHLGGHATAQDVAEAWPRWYEANKAVIGPDPDLIHPGQRLVVPTSGGAR